MRRGEIDRVAAVAEDDFEAVASHILEHRLHLIESPVGFGLEKQDILSSSATSESDIACSPDAERRNFSPSPIAELHEVQDHGT